MWQAEGLRTRKRSVPAPPVRPATTRIDIDIDMDVVTKEYIDVDPGRRFPPEATRARARRHDCHSAIAPVKPHRTAPQVRMPSAVA